MRKKYTKTDIARKCNVKLNFVSRFVNSLLEKEPSQWKKIYVWNNRIFFSEEGFNEICEKLLKKEKEKTIHKPRKKTQLLIIEYYTSNINLSIQEISKDLTIEENIIRKEINKWRENNKFIIIPSKINKYKYKH